MYYVYTPPEKQIVYPFNLSDLRRTYPNVSFPEAISDEEAAKFHCFPVNGTAPPDASAGKKVVQVDPVQAGGEWFVAWALVDITPEETETQWATIRSERNAKLTASDWTQLPDAPVDAGEWAVYRQALRDVTKQTDPFAIVWPIAPGA